MRELNKTKENTNEKYNLNAFRSPSPMNELCEYINTWEKKNFLWNKEYINTGDLLINHNLNLDDEEVIKQMKKIITSCVKEFRESVDQRLDKSKLNQGNFTYYADLIFKKYKELIDNEFPDLSEEERANYLIKVSYLKKITFKQLAWGVYGDYILTNLKNNSPKNKSTKITEVQPLTDDSYEFLGKYYIMQESTE